MSASAWRASMVATALAALAAATPVAAQPAADAGDYDIDNNNWNGLTTFTALARGMGLTVELRRDLDWNELAPTDLLVILYPSSNIVPHHLSAFISSGGRVVLGDDFGSSNRIFAELGLLRDRAVNVATHEHYDGLPFAPLARRVGEHPLGEGAPSIVTNHPAILTELGFTRAVYQFGDDETVIAVGDLGSGKLVALADPSVLINRMLQFEGNFQLAVNLTRFLMAGSSRRLTIVTGDFTLRGEPPPTKGADDGTVTAFVNAVNEWLRRDVNAYVATPATARGLSVALAAVVAILLVLVLPLRPRGELDGRWIRARPESTRPLGLEGIVASYDSPQSRRRGFALAAAALRDGIVRRLADVAGTSDPLHAISQAELFRALEALGYGEAAARLHPIYRTLKDLPSRAHAASQWESRFVSQREFERLHAAVGQLYRSLGE